MAQDIAVGFDFDHTLGVDNRLERTTAIDMLGEYARARGVTCDMAEAEGTIDGVLAVYRSGEKTVENAISGFFERFAPGGGNYVIDEAQKFRERVVERAPQYVADLPGAKEMLAALDALGVRYAILTNGWSPLQEEKARLIDFKGPVFVSERIAARKPSREAFDVLAKHFDLPLERIWYVGDDPETDIVGPQALGLTAVWFDWEGGLYPAALPKPAHTIHALAELPPLLQGQLSGAAKSPR